MSQETRERILQAAAKLFYEQGFSATSTRLIAAEAGVNEVTLFRRFGSKEKLLEEIITEKYGVLYTFRASFFQEGASFDLEQDLRTINRMYLEILHRNRMVISIMFERSMQRFDDHFLDFPRGFKQFLITYLEEMERRGKISSVDYSRIADHFISANIGYLLIKERFGNSILQINDDELIEQNIEAYCTVLRRER